MTDLRVPPRPAAPSSPAAAGGRRWRTGAAVAVGVVVLSGVVSRFVTGSPLWLDEALSVTISRLDLGDLPAALRRDGHPPLYYFLLHGWSAVLGDGDLAVRSLSGVFAVAALPLAWLAGARVAGRRGAVAALVLFASSPFLVRYGTEARMYALVGLLVLAGHLVVRDALDRGRDATLRLLALAVVSGLAYLSHYWSFYLAASVVVVLAVVARRDADAERRRAARRCALAVAGGGVLFLPWLPSFLSQLGSTGTPWAPPARPPVVVGSTLVDLGGPSAEGVLLAVALAIAVVLGLLATRTPSVDVPEGSAVLALDLRTVPAARGEAAVAALTLALGTVVGLVTAAAFATRYAAVVAPLVLLVAARGVAVLPGRALRASVLAVAVLLGGAGIYRNATYDRTQSEVVAAALTSEIGPGDVVVTCPDQLGPSLLRALDQAGVDGVDVVGYPTLDRPERIDWVDYEERNAAADPAAVAAEVVAGAAPDATVWLYRNTSYRTFEGQCEQLSTALGAARPQVREVVAANAGRYFESGTLVAFGPTSG